MRNTIYFLLLFSKIAVPAFSQNYLPGKLCARMKDSPNEKRSFEQLDRAFEQLKIKGMNSLSPMGKGLKKSTSHVDPSRLLMINYDAAIDAKEAAKILMATGEFDYVEPHFVFDLLHVPNDPFADSSALEHPSFQEALIMHKAYEAWDWEKGDTNMVIAIIDAGFNIEHEDLKSQIKYNTLDTAGNGINDDNDFFYYHVDGNYYELIDNYAGWDVADWDGDVSNSVQIHGTLVAGTSSAATNNGLGVAGMGYKCKFLPIKAALDASPNSIQYGYIGILYAMQKGCKVINCSWGSPNSYSRFGQDVVNIATFGYDATVVAAAGNPPSRYSNYYPACFDNVLSVTGTRIDYSLYGKASYFADMNGLARDVRLLGGKTNDEYIIQHGTSYSTPMVAATVALVRSQRPHLTALQAAEQVRVSGYIIDTLALTKPFFEQMGYALDMHKALTDSTIPSVRVIDEKYGSKSGFLTFTGDTIQLQGAFLNFLYPTTATEIEITIEKGNAKMIDSVFNVGSIATMDTSYQNFIFYLNDGAAEGDSIIFRAGFKDGNYKDYQYFVWLVEGNTGLITELPSSEPNIIQKVYPNPFNNELNISTHKPINRSVTFTVTDLKGQLVYKKNHQMHGLNTTLTLPHLSSGLYILKMDDCQKSYYEKVLKY